MKVYCDVEYKEIENENGRDVPGVVVTCGRCGHQTEAYGQHDGSVKRCMVLLKEECPKGERNYYTEGNVTQATQSWDNANGGLSAQSFTSPAAINHVLETAGQNIAQPPKPSRKFTKPATRAPGVSAGPFSGGRGGAHSQAAPVTVGQIPKLIAENNFCIIKCATTGLSTNDDQICQIGLCQVDGGVARWRISVNVKPSIPIPPKATEIHGLDAQKLYFAPSFKDIANEIDDFIGDRTLLGYNISKFDLPIVTRQLIESGVNITGELAHLDVLLFERKFAQEAFAVNEKQRHGLADAARRWGVPLAVNHDALNDAKIVWAVFVELCARFPELGEASRSEAIEVMKAERALTSMGLRTADKFEHLR